jgi:hypothetical protein
MQNINHGGTEMNLKFYQTYNNQHNNLFIINIINDLYILEEIIKLKILTRLIDNIFNDLFLVQ